MSTDDIVREIEDLVVNGYVSDNQRERAFDLIDTLRTRAEAAEAQAKQSAEAHDFLARQIGAAAVASTMAPGESLIREAGETRHMIVGVVERLVARAHDAEATAARLNAANVRLMRRLAPALSAWVASADELAKMGQRAVAAEAALTTARAEGAAAELAPRLEWLRAVKSGTMAPADYFKRYRVQLASISAQLGPGWLIVDSGALHDVYSGDTICCSCRRGTALGLFERGPSCHLEVAAEELRRAGWLVGLWGGAPW